MKYIFKKKSYIVLFSIIDALGSGIFCIFKFFIQKAVPKVVSKILIVRLDHIGDVVNILFVPQAIKSRFPNSRLTLLCSSAAKSLFVNNRYLDEVIVFDAPWFNRNKQTKGSLKKLLLLAQTLKKQKFDIGIDLRGDFRHNLLLFLAGVHYRIGYGCTGGAFLLDYAASYDKSVHTRRRNETLLKTLGIFKTDEFLNTVYCSADDQKAAQTLLRDNFIEHNTPFIIIHPCAGAQAKNWGVEKFVKLTQLLFKRGKEQIVFIGDSKDTSIIQDIITKSQVSAVNLSGKTAVSVLPALFSCAKLFVGVDSGPAHIAATCNIPVVVVYSGTVLNSEWKPVGEKVKVIAKHTDCEGCEKTDCREMICLNAITAEEVFSEIERVLKS